MKNVYKFIAGTLILLSPSFSSAQSPAFGNSSFENWGSSCPANTTPTMWVNYSNGGSAADASDYTSCPHSIPGAAQNGQVTARLVSFSNSAGEGVYQDVSGFVVNNPYEISFYYAGSNLYGGVGMLRLHLFINDNDVAQTPAFSSTVTAWTQFSFPFTATATTNKIGVRLYMDVSGSAESEIDNFSIESTVGLKQNEAAHGTIKVFPNPSSGLFTVSSASHIEVYNSLGRMVYSAEGNGSSTQVDIANQPPGIYLLKAGERTVRIIRN